MELMTSVATAVTNSFAGTATRNLKLLLPSAATWLAAVSLWTHQPPGLLLQSAIDWCGLSWSITPALNWIHSRSDAVQATALLVAFVAFAGLRAGVGAWLANARVQFGLMISVLVWLETSAPTLGFIAVLLAGPVYSAVRDRSLNNGLLVLAAPWMLLLGPLAAMADLLGVSDRPRPAQHRPAVTPNTDSPLAYEVRQRAIADYERLHPPAPRRYTAIPENRPIGPAPLGEDPSSRSFGEPSLATTQADAI